MNRFNKITDDTVIAIIGNGNVATHLAMALDNKCTTVIVNSHTFENIPPHIDIALISVKDDAICHVAERIKGRANVAAHTSGSIPITVLENVAEHYGVFYPLQTFSKNVDLIYSDIPVLIEGSDNATVNILAALARTFSDNVSEADSFERKRLHLASVFACNFTNRMVSIADKILKDTNMDYRILIPLLRQTIDKLKSLHPDAAQTGPAARGDLSVINDHLSMLNNEPRLKRIYQDITAEIMSSHNTKDRKQ